MLELCSFQSLPHTCRAPCLQEGVQWLAPLMLTARSVHQRASCGWRGTSEDSLSNELLSLPTRQEDNVTMTQL